MPFPNANQIKLFCDFYQEYKTKCINSPFAKMDEVTNARDFVLKRVETWKKISDYKGLLERTTGAILIDTGSRNETTKAVKHLLTLQILFFNELIKRISKKDYFK